MNNAWSLKAIRNNLNMTQKEMAEALGMPYQTYVSKEQGRSELTLEEARRISNLSGVSVDFIKC